MSDQLFKKRKEEQQIRRQKVLVQRSETWLFVCEGTKTEPIYLDRLIKFANEISSQSPIKSDIRGVGRNTENLVQSVDDFYNFADEFNSLKRGLPYAKTFVLFDKDSFKASQFDNAIKMALSRGYIPIWSNECFELWYILHYEYLNSDIGRETYFKKLTDLLGEKYDKSEDVFSLIHSPQKIKKAMDNARKLEKLFKENDPPHKKVPCTQMNVLIEHIQERLRIDLSK
ncbi:MAG: RloB domain-containing protein [Oscillospiraceae bacterium]|nr:RloB domain-containing protein [Oscillospiraceae bacterium]